MTPLQEKSYELLVRVTSLNIADGGDWRIKRLRKRLFDDAIHFGSAVQSAISAADGFLFQHIIHDVHEGLRHIKLWTKLLDDLGFMEPETLLPMNETAEEVHRLILAIIRRVSSNERKN